jgi:hypothetical protein
MLSDADRGVFARLADALIPAWEKMPAASAVGVHKDLLDAVLAARPDLVDGVKQAIEYAAQRDTSAALNGLYRDDRSAFDALTLAATGAYYMAEGVRTVIGYPGQESPPYDPFETPDYLLDGSLERVTRRGPVYRQTPR